MRRIRSNYEPVPSKSFLYSTDRSRRRHQKKLDSDIRHLENQTPNIEQMQNKKRDPIFRVLSFHYKFIGASQKLSVSTNKLPMFDVESKCEQAGGCSIDELQQSLATVFIFLSQYQTE